MTARARVLSAALLRAGLLAAVLAIVAGIFGMHVMTAHSSHAGHTAASAESAAGGFVAGQPAGDAAAGQSAGQAAVVHSHAEHAAGHTAVSPTFSAAESCGSGCPGAHEAGAPCIPLGKTASLAVVPPQAVTAEPAHATTTRAAVGYSYIPSSPTPCDLSISRT